MARTTPAASDTAVPVFFLYGEPRRLVSPRFLHLETLASRSRPTDWNIRPHSHADLHHIFLIAQGSGRMDADGTTAWFTAPCLLTVPQRTVHGFVWERETAGQVLTLADSYLRDLLVREPAFSTLFARPWCLPGADAEVLEARMAELGRELAWSAPGHDAAVEAHLVMVLVEALRRASLVASAQPHPGRAASLVARFRAAVERRYRSGDSLAAYAADLGVTEATLRRACAELAAGPPIGIVHDRVTLEAQRMLFYTNMSVAEIAATLGFDDSAYFTRFFTRRAGRSPRQFRSERGTQGADPV